MEDKIISPMQDFLPGALSKWILVSSIALSGFLLLVPSYDLPAKYLTDTEITKLLLRLLSAGMPILLGLTALIILQVRHNHKVTRALKKSMSDATSLSVDIERINNEHIVKTTELNNHISGLRSELNRISGEYSDTLRKVKKNNEAYDALQQHYSDIERIHNDHIARLKKEHEEEIKSLCDNCKNPPKPPVSMAAWT